MNKYYFAVDLGASSGRTMIARIDSGKIEMEEINRFPNHIIETGGHCYWDILELYRNILDGLKKVAARKAPAKSQEKLQAKPKSGFKVKDPSKTIVVVNSNVRSKAPENKNE